MLLLGIAIVALSTLFAGFLRNDLWSATFLTAVVIVDLALMGWRLASIGEAGFGSLDIRRWSAAHLAVDLRSGARARRLASVAVVVGLLLATVLMHAWVAMIIGRLNATLGEVFSGGYAGGLIEGEAEPPPINEPDYHWDGEERVTFLLLGLDAGPGRPQSLTDTILAVSIDPVAETAVMVSVPRDTGYVPLPDRSVYPNGVYPKKINELATEASTNPELWCPDMSPIRPDECGLRSLERSIGLYLGIPIQYYAQVDLDGFAQLIDAVGGVTLCLPGKMVDPQYTGPPWQERGIELPAGCNRYDGAHALAYARVRKGWIELPDGTREVQSDFKRAERQQKVLLELRHELASADLLFELPAVLDAVGETVLTDFPRSMAGDLATLVPLITGNDIEREVLDLPDYVDPPVAPLLNYLLIPRRDDIRAGMQGLLGPEVPLEGWYLGSQLDGPPG